MSENSKDNSIAVITGASSGIGAAFARRFAQDGYNLILIARREELLKELSKELTELGINVKYFHIDLSQEDELQKIEELIKQTEKIEILVNNAGFGGKRKVFYNVDVSDHLNMLQVHNIAPLKLTSAVIPGMIKKGKGIIINVSSVASFTPSPTVMYSTTKNFLNFFSESLDLLLRRKGIKIQALCPGFTITDFHKKLGYKSGDSIYRRNFMTAEKVVNISVRNLKRRKIYCIPGFRNKLLVLLMRVLPKNIISFFYGRIFTRTKKK